MAETSKGKCLHCRKAAKTRGMCVACYASALRTVERGQTTWAALEKSGMAIASAKQHSGFTKAFAKRQAK